MVRNDRKLHYSEAVALGGKSVKNYGPKIIKTTVGKMGM